MEWAWRLAEWAEAADAGGAIIDYTIFAQYGVLGVIAVILILYANSTVKDLRERATRQELEIQRLNDERVEKNERMAVALEESARVIAQSQQTVETLQRMLDSALDRARHREPPTAPPRRKAPPRDEPRYLDGGRD
jgi:hypothetical protein